MQLFDENRGRGLIFVVIRQRQTEAEKKSASAETREHRRLVSPRRGRVHKIFRSADRFEWSTRPTGGAADGDYRNVRHSTTFACKM